MPPGAYPHSSAPRGVLRSKDRGTVVREAALAARNATKKRVSFSQTNATWDPRQRWNSHVDVARLFPLGERDRVVDATGSRPLYNRGEDTAIGRPSSDPQPTFVRSKRSVKSLSLPLW